LEQAIINYAIDLHVELSCVHREVVGWVRFPTGHLCALTLDKLFTPVCLCHQAV